MASYKFAALVAFVFVSVVINIETEALKCHQCTSQIDAECADPMWYEPEKEGAPRKLKTEKFLRDCPTDKNYTICRKIFQNVRGNERVIRSCGYVEHKNECYQTVLEEYNTHVCQCKEDGCNGAQSINLSFAVMTTAMAIAAFFAH
jgi:hypothetical protein